MKKWRVPSNSTWTTEFQYVCFNDECSYFERGWQWMQTKFHVTSSYRFKLDPASGATGPLPVWSNDALKDQIIPGDESDE